jgi:hypothetical protein
LGVEAYWLEVVWGARDPSARECIDVFRRHVEALGVAPWVVVAFLPEGAHDHPTGPIEYLGTDAGAFRECARDALLLNLANSLPSALRTGFARTALFDLDPGPFQLWAREFDLGVGKHDVHLTIGANLGAADSPVPLDGVEWRRVWPAVHLPAWPDQGGIGGDRYTTVTQWWTNQYAFLDGETYDCNKRPGFVEMIDLPEHTASRSSSPPTCIPAKPTIARSFCATDGGSPIPASWPAPPRRSAATCNRHAASSAAPSRRT